METVQYSFSRDGDYDPALEKNIYTEHKLPHDFLYAQRSTKGSLNKKVLKPAEARQLVTQHGVTINHIEPGKPAQNGYIERFNRTYREDVLDQYWFYDLEEVRNITDEWMDMYNGERPHSSLGNKTPWEFMACG